MTLETLHSLWLQLDPFLASSTAKTLLLVVSVGLLRVAFNRALDRNPELGTHEARRRWKVTVRNVGLVVMLAGAVLIWAEELSSLMLSLVALGAAFVIAFKEVISCLSGTIVRTTTQAFAIGDRIEVNGVRGDVIDYSLLSTTLMEVGPSRQSHQYTGRAVVLPNSLFLSHPVLNENFTDAYLLHQFQVAIPRASDWRKAEQALLSAAVAECGEHLERARAYLSQLAQRRSLEPISVDPRVILKLDDPGRIELLVRVAVPAGHKGRIEQAILRRFLDATAETAAAVA